MRWALLDGVPEEDVRRLLSVARRRKFERGEVVFHEHDPADTLHLIAKGHFVVRSQTPLGERAIYAVLGPGEMVGELSLVDEPGARRTASCVAIEGGETLSVHQLDFDGLRKSHPETSQVLIAILAAQVRRLSRHLIEALYVPADKRVLRRLCEVAALFDDGVVPLNQEDIASLAGTSRATVNRVLREEAERGTLELARGRTIVRDAEALAQRGR
jgi:CRP-like cAMP-binding protein